MTDKETLTKLLDELELSIEKQTLVAFRGAVPAILYAKDAADASRSAIEQYVARLQGENAELKAEVQERDEAFGLLDDDHHALIEHIGDIESAAPTPEEWALILSWHQNETRSGEAPREAAIKAKALRSSSRPEQNK